MELSEYAKQLRELADIIEEQDQKYYVQVFDYYMGYLNFSKRMKDYSVESKTEAFDLQTKFTRAEIEDLKINPALKAINWDEVNLIPVD